MQITACIDVSGLGLVSWWPPEEWEERDGFMTVRFSRGHGSAAGQRSGGSGAVDARACVELLDERAQLASEVGDVPVARCCSPRVALLLLATCISTRASDVPRPKLRVPPALVINLPRRRRAFAKAKKQMDDQGVYFERIDAVNGRALSESERRANAMAARALLTPGMIGCYLSHRKCWQPCGEGATTRCSSSRTTRC